ncbi:RrF2 family transcriptional regulator [Flagellimonas sediminis]|uniref:Rrf2 family transcriptional regulator n=1 Tax=Flagellimonas sediminis TaxID=2696468 RepID=A0A6I5L481_9FLAO|nr:Rrf2 family transcriptional regulator [Allomuricauda sediminis]NDV45302.1 Rrf2 family transcriptional regulator [Allomuricauda sediminis]
MLTNAGKYAIRAVMYLAIHSNANKKMGAKTIAGALDIPQAFLAQLLRTLTTDRLISSSKGPGGGFYLEDADREHTLWQVIVSIDGEHRFHECFLGLSICDDAHPCPVHHLVSPFKKELLFNFQERTIGQLIEEIKDNGTVISLKMPFLED